MNPPPQSRVGTRFAERYDLLGVLGTGGMGSVYRARHAFTGADVALKIIHASVARSANARERFLREAQAPSAIGHPGIVAVSDAGVADDGTLYLALELLEGTDLATALEDRQVDGAKAVDTAVALLDCLHAAHSSGLVHRDIKPENVFLTGVGTASERVRLLDFGITRSLTDTEAEQLTQTGSVLGTPHYMSPEQARGQPVDPRADLYSVGGLLFFALTGRTAFVADNYNLLIVAIMTNPAPATRSVRSTVPQDLADVIDRALEADPANRFATAAEMRDALRACAPLNLPAPEVEKKSFAHEPTMASAEAFGTAPTLASGTARSFPADQAVPGARAAVGPSSKTGWVWAGIGALLIATVGAAAYGLGHFGASEAPPQSHPEPETAKTSRASTPPDRPVDPEHQAATTDGGEDLDGEHAVQPESHAEEDPAAALAARRRKDARLRARQLAAQQEKVRQTKQRESRRIQCRTRCMTDLGRCNRDASGGGRGTAACHNTFARCTGQCTP